MRRLTFFAALSLLPLTVLAASADLAVSYEGPSLIDRGRGIVSVILTNKSHDSATNVRVSATSGVPLTCVVCALGFVSPNSRNDALFQLPANLASGTTVVFAVSVTSDTPDPDPSNNTIFVSVTVVDRPDLAIQVNGPSTYDPDTPVLYVVNWQNRASIPAIDATVTVDLPDGTAVTSLDGADCIVTGAHLVCPAGSVQPGGSRTLKINAVQPVRYDGPKVAITASISAAAQDDLNLDDNTSTFPFTLTKVILVTTADDDGDGSLRRAIETANSMPDPRPKIAFQIPSPPFTIAPRTPLPAITRAVEIDGLWQARHAGGHIEIDGAGVATGSGLLVNVPCLFIVHDVTLRGFPDNGIVLTSSQPCSTSGPYYYDVPVDEVRHCVLAENGLRGIAVFLPPTTDNIFAIVNNDIHANLRSGIFAASGPKFLVAENRIDGNGASGVYVAASGSSIANNVITNNADFGIAVDANAQYVDFGNNSIFDNGRLGIDIGLNGPGGGLPAPTLFTATYDAAADTTTIKGHYPLISRRYVYALHVELFASDHLSPHFHAEGQTSIGSSSIGTASDFSIVIKGNYTGKIVTATATVVDINTFGAPPIAPLGINPYGFYSETSEFSQAVTVR